MQSSTLYRTSIADVWLSQETDLAMPLTIEIRIS